jgi:hypothetical protein
MTLRMVLEAAEGETVLALHGWLVGPEVAEFERVVAAAPLPLRVDLANLVSADLPGIAALRAQRVRGVRLANTSPYIAILLDGAVEVKPLRRRGRRGSTSARVAPKGRRT